MMHCLLSFPWLVQSWNNYVGFCALLVQNLRLRKLQVKSGLSSKWPKIARKHYDKVAQFSSVIVCFIPSPCFDGGDWPNGGCLGGITTRNIGLIDFTVIFERRLLKSQATKETTSPGETDSEWMRRKGCSSFSMNVLPHYTGLHK